jgi:hypothetical protein
MEPVLARSQDGFMQEKKLAEITVRVDLTTKAQLVGLAEKRGLDGGASELVRNAIAVSWQKNGRNTKPSTSYSDR